MHLYFLGFLKIEYRKKQFYYLIKVNLKINVTIVFSKYSFKKRNVRYFKSFTVDARPSTLRLD